MVSLSSGPVEKRGKHTLSCNSSGLQQQTLLYPFSPRRISSRSNLSPTLARIRPPLRSILEADAVDVVAAFVVAVAAAFAVVAVAAVVLLPFRSSP